MLGQFHCGNTIGRRDYIGRQASDHYPFPFLDYTSTAIPRNFSELLDWSEFMYLSSPEVREMYKRLFNYFNTDIDIQAIDSGRQTLDDDDSRQWKDLLETDLQWNMHGANLLDNVAIYGNDFISVVAPHRRFLKCARCAQQIELETFAKQVGSDFKYEKGKFVGRCRSQVCKRNRVSIDAMEVVDMRIKEPDKFTIKHWPVREMILWYYDWSDSAQVYWKIPEHYKRAVAFGDLRTLAEADLGVLDAIHKNVLFKFRDDRIFHAKEPVISGLRTKGWGLPRTMFLARQAWTLQILRKQIQALGIDFIVPMRVLTPANRNTVGQTGVMINPAMQMNHDDFARQVAAMRARHRRDPTQIHTLQTPAKYSIYGGEANQLFPVDLHNMAKEDLLDAGGFPINIYKADLTVQAAPVGLRLFEAQNRSIPLMLNLALAFVSNRISELSGKDPVQARHQRVLLVDNIETSMARLQMAMTGQTSMTNALKPLNMNYEEELRQNARDQDLAQEIAREQQEKMQNQDSGMQMLQQYMQPQGDPATAGGQGGQMMQDPLAGMLPSNGLIIPTDTMGMEQSITALAQQLAQMDPVSRQRELGILREQNPTAHGLLRTRLEQVDQQMATEGRHMMIQGAM